MVMPTVQAAISTEVDMKALTWHCRPFSALDSGVLYQLLQMRQTIFVVEQSCPYPDLDDLDQDSDHLYALDQDQPVAYARCLPPGLAWEPSSIGRVAVTPGLRRFKLGHELMRRAIAHNFAQWPDYSIRIGAQAYLEQFYQQLGFISEQDPYMEDGILHMHMYLAGTGEPN
jgi:ElaA protein